MEKAFVKVKSVDNSTWMKKFNVNLCILNMVSDNCEGTVRPYGNSLKLLLRTGFDITQM